MKAIIAVLLVACCCAQFPPPDPTVIAAINAGTQKCLTFGIFNNDKCKNDPDDVHKLAGSVLWDCRGYIFNISTLQDPYVRPLFTQKCMAYNDIPVFDFLAPPGQVGLDTQSINGFWITYHFATDTPYEGLYAESDLYLPSADPAAQCQVLFAKRYTTAIKKGTDDDNDDDSDNNDSQRICYKTPEATGDLVQSERSYQATRYTNGTVEVCADDCTRTCCRVAGTVERFPPQDCCNCIATGPGECKTLILGSNAFAVKNKIVYIH